jgi:hypothetical protein
VRRAPGPQRSQTLNEEPRYPCRPQDFGPMQVQVSAWGGSLGTSTLDFTQFEANNPVTLEQYGPSVDEPYFLSTSSSNYGIAVTGNANTSGDWLSNTGSEDCLTTTWSPNVENFLHQSISSVEPSSNWMQPPVQPPVNIPDAQQLANLSERQLEDLENKIAQARLAKQQTPLESLTSIVEAPRVTNVEKPDKVRNLSQKKKQILVCEYEGCNSTFSRRKDRTRHVRNKHSEAPGFVCPIIDCPMGTRHTMQRSDKLRDHLRGKAVSCYTWLCVIPGCSETAMNKSRWLIHMAQHDVETRRANRSRLNDYGFKEFYRRYSMCHYLCQRPGCPFGTNKSEVMNEHLLIPHNGPHCPCPMPECQTICKSHDAVALHLAVSHSCGSRQVSREILFDQGFFVGRSAFTCPILGCLHICKASWNDGVARSHCQMHSFDDLLAVAVPLVNAWRFCWEGQRLWIGSKIYCPTPTSNQIFTHLAFSDEELRAVKSLADVNRFCVEKGINLP